MPLPLELAQLLATQIGLPSIQAVDDSPPKEDRLFLYDRNTHIRFLVDSGSVVSLFPVSRIFPRPEAGDLFLRAANGSIIRTFGEKEMGLDFGLRRPIEWSFILADIKLPIIGADLLRHHGLLINLQENCLIDSTTKLRTTGSVAAAEVYNVTPVQQETTSQPTNELTRLLETYKELFEAALILQT